MIELRQAAKDMVFDLLDEINTLGRKKKMAMCKLEDTLYECFESSEDYEEDEDFENEYETPSDMDEIQYRKQSRNRSAMRDMHREDMDDDMNMRSYRSHNMRMRRRNRMGRYV